MAFWPGPGLGGHCIPVDPLYLSWKLRFVDFVPRLIELADEVNRSMPDHVVELVADALNDAGKPMKGSKVAVLGVAYKPDVDDTRESPALRVIDLLERKGMEVACHDPHVAAFTLEDGRPREGVGFEDALEGADLTLVLTNHSVFDVVAILDRSSILVDTRNITEGLEDPRIRRLGDRLPR
jgi:UDP-N-acetyl-D-glucosamine dehydrogenase